MSQYAGKIWDTLTMRAIPEHFRYEVLHLRLHDLDIPSNELIFPSISDIF